MKRAFAAAARCLVFWFAGLNGTEPTKAERVAQLRAEAHRTQDHLRKIQSLERAVELTTPTAELYMDLGTAYDAVQRFADARRQYRKAYELVLARGDRKLASLLLAQIAMEHARERHPLDAVKVLEQAGRLNPANPDITAEITKFRVLLTAQVLTAAEINRGFETTREFDIQGTRPSLDIHVNFAFDSAELTDQGVRQADELGKALSSAEHEGCRFEIVGHTDRIGSDAYNLDLSQRRAIDVKSYLTGRFAILPERLTAIGMGKRELLQPGSTPEDDAVNRRVQVTLIR